MTQSRHMHIVICENDDHLREELQRNLGRDLTALGIDHTLHAFNDGEPAFAHLAAHGIRNTALLTDQEMLRLNGLALLKRLTFSGIMPDLVAVASGMAPEDPKSGPQSGMDPRDFNTLRTAHGFTSDRVPLIPKPLYINGRMLGNELPIFLQHVADAAYAIEFILCDDEQKELDYMKAHIGGALTPHGIPHRVTAFQDGKAAYDYVTAAAKDDFPHMAIITDQEMGRYSFGINLLADLKDKKRLPACAALRTGIKLAALETKMDNFRIKGLVSYVPKWEHEGLPNPGESFDAFLETTLVKLGFASEPAEADRANLIQTAGLAQLKK